MVYVYVKFVQGVYTISYNVSLGIYNMKSNQNIFKGKVLPMGFKSESLSMYSNMISLAR